MKRIAIAVMVLFLSGCSTLQIETPDGFKLKYTRKISGLQLTKATIKPNADGSVTATVEGVKSDNQAFMETINTAIGKIP
jgi:uncharacterized lipoprotein